MPSLTYLKRREACPYWPVDCPNLTHLVLIPGRDFGELEDKCIRLPYLVSFSLYLYDSLNAFRVLDIPSLDSFGLRIKKGGRKSANAGLFRDLWPLSSPEDGMNPSNPKLEVSELSLRDINIDLQLLASAVACQTSLKKFIIIGLDIKSNFFDCLMPKQVEQHLEGSGTPAQPEGVVMAWQVGAPALKRLSIDFAGRLVEDQAGIEASARAFVAARTRAGAPLEELKMRCSKETAWKELVEPDVVA